MDILEEIEEKRNKLLFTPFGIAPSFYIGDTDVAIRNHGNTDDWVLIVSKEDYIIDYMPLCMKLFVPNIEVGLLADDIEKQDLLFTQLFKKVDKCGINLLRIHPFPEEYRHVFKKIIVDDFSTPQLTIKILSDFLAKDGEIYVRSDCIIPPAFRYMEIRNNVRYIFNIPVYEEGEVVRQIGVIGLASWKYNNIVGSRRRVVKYNAYKPFVYEEKPILSHETIAIRGKAPEVLCIRNTVESQSTPKEIEIKKAPNESQCSTKESQCIIDVDMELIDIDSITNTKCDFQYITYHLFETMCLTPDFIKSFHDNLLKLYQMKIVIYEKYIKTLKDDVDMMNMTLAKMNIPIRNMSLVKDVFPHYSSVNAHITFIESLVDIIKTQPVTLSLDLLEKRFKKIVTSPKGLRAIVGRTNVKDHIARLLFSFAKDFRSLMFTFGSLALLGDAGMGKTALMKTIGYVLSKSCILVRKSFKIVSRRDLISPYLGSTAHHTRDVLLASLEGVIGIDECHSLISKTTHDYGHESVSELVNFMDKFMGLTFVIVSGYTKPMEEMFFSQNEGLARRFRNKTILDRYTPKELTTIFIRQLSSLGTTLSQSDINIAYSAIHRKVVLESNAFPNQAGDMLNYASNFHIKTACVISDDFNFTPLLIDTFL